MSWALAAGVPDPRSDRYRNQPLIGAQCFEAFSEQMWKFGFRFHPELQQIWVNPRSGPAMNFEAWGTTKEKPEEVPAESEPEQLAQLLTAAAPQAAKKLAQVQTAEDAQQVGEELQKQIADGIARIQQLQSQLKPGDS